MRSLSPTPENNRRVIPFPRMLAAEPLASEEPRAPLPAHPHRDDHTARHYLKFMLPSIPVTMFVVGFVYCSLLVSTPTVIATRAASRSALLPLLGALLLGLTSGVLCIIIYLGYLRTTNMRGADA